MKPDHMIGCQIKNRHLFEVPVDHLPSCCTAAKVPERNRGRPHTTKCEFLHIKSKKQYFDSQDKYSDKLKQNDSSVVK